MENDVPEETVILRADLRHVLGELPLFKGLDEQILTDIAGQVEWLSLPGGTTLFETGEDSDAMYFVLSGSLYVFNNAAQERLLGHVSTGGSVGEMGLITERQRAGTVIAARDSELARLSRTAFNEVFCRHPQATLRLAKLTVHRLEAAQGHRRSNFAATRTFTIIPQSIDLDVAEFATAFVKALAVFGRTELVWSVRGASHTSHWFHRIETENDYVVYVADPRASSWSSLCIRQADTLLLLAQAESTIGSWLALSTAKTVSAALQRKELILLNDGKIVAGAAAQWLKNVPNTPHHHVGNNFDIARLARLLTGRGVGIVFSGGGARGFAHIGIVKALHEAKIPIDLVGGTSLGAILGAAVAARWSIAEMKERFHRTFVKVNPLGDYTFPLVSLTSGRRVSQLLHSEFGDLTIEDLPLPYYCVSSNLTTGHAEVHRSGTLWRWLRASVAIPGVLPPVMNRGEVLVDGGSINNLPVDIMREQARGPVIGCDVGADRAFNAEGDEIDMPKLWQLVAWFQRRAKQRPNIFRILWRAGMINSTATTMAHREKTDLLLQPPLAQVDMLNWRAFDRTIELGYTYTVQRLAELPQGNAIVRAANGGEA
jgi:NTE family protein